MSRSRARRFTCSGFLQQQGLENVTLAGHSLGGWLAAEMAVMCPHVVDKLILIDAAGIRPRRGEILDIFLHGASETRRLSFCDASQAPEYADLFDHDLSTEEREVATQNQEMSARLSWKPYLFSPSLPYLLPRVQAPTLLIWGREDRIVPLEVGELYQQALPKARLEVIDRCGHLPHVEKPAEFSRLVLAFLKSVKQERSAQGWPLCSPVVLNPPTSTAPAHTSSGMTSAAIRRR